MQNNLVHYFPSWQFTEKKEYKNILVEALFRALVFRLSPIRRATFAHMLASDVKV